MAETQDWRPPGPERPWIVGLGDGSVHSVSSSQQVLDLVRQTHESIGPDDYAEMLNVLRGINVFPMLDIGVGTERVPLMWFDGPEQSARSLSDRPEDALLDDEEHELEVRYGGDYQWFMPSELVDRTAATAALVQFLATGHRPDAVAWDDV